ncbi:MAG: PIG-L family deacetylase [Verrucomicrobia bacterium]|nr:MAG: PIG-L family deacetylase [Verrucomicrobiota bacterium]
MKLNLATADVFIPDGADVAAALKRTTHLAVGAHQDDLEFMALHGVLECFGRDDRWFCGVVCTNGAGSPRAGVYANCTDEQMRAIRRVEQRTAASIGHYGAMLQLDHPSSVVKTAANPALRQDLTEILRATQPDVVYTHNPADKHDTHIGVMAAVIAALRELPAPQRPKQVLGCEVWRDLDWLPDRRKVMLDVSRHENLAAALNGVFDSQITGGKRYDLAVLGRRRAHATFFESHGVDTAEMLTFAMDLMPLVQNPSLSIAGYVESLIEEFKAETKGKLQSWK